MSLNKLSGLLTVLFFFPLDPGTDPRFAVDEDGWWGAATGWGWKGADGPPKDFEGTDCAIFCFLRDADIVGLGIES